MNVVVVAIALMAFVFVLRQVLHSALDSRIDRALAQEANELAQRADETLDAVADARNAARGLLADHLGTNVPDRDEAMIAVQDGTAFLQSADAPGDLTAYVSAFAGLTEPTYLDLDTADGPVRLLAQPVMVAGEQVGLLAIAWFLRPELDAIDDVVGDAWRIAALALVAASCAAWLIAGRIIKPITLLASTASDITQHDVSRRLAVQGPDEIASLIVSFNAMLDRLEATLRSQRTFLDAAGHELRTPITVVRGHLELAGSEPGRLEVSRPIVLAELDRMARMVDDLLVLARAEQVDFVVVRPVDADTLLDDLLARVTTIEGPRWSIDERPAGVVHVDPERVTQAVLNLAVNAARHTPVGGDVAIGARFVDQHLHLWVRDTGEGVDLSDQARIFERFKRGANQPRSTGNAGLGLAIVQLIAGAHGGSVLLDSAPGRGATFTMVLPIEGGGVSEGARRTQSPATGIERRTGVRWRAS